MRLFKKLRRKLNYLNDDHIEDIHQAYLLAEQAHSKQKRQSGEPYITHPVAVAGILADARLDHQSIMAALLHDVIEDTEVKKQDLEEKFGEQVAALVDGVSKLTKIEFKSRAEAQAENFRKMVLAMSKDIRVILVKLADRLHNMRTLGPLRTEKRHRIAQETLEIYAPIAKRLGMHNVAIELEDLGFAARYPRRYNILKAAVGKIRRHRTEILKTVEKALKGALKRSELPPCRMLGREKHFYSIYKKMRDKHITLSEIMDIYAYRIIVDSVDTCYRVLGLAHSLYKPLPERFKDYIAIPKANGYQSLHTTLFGPFGVPVELQIRTQEMDDMANNGIAAHWLYKTADETIDSSQMRAQQWVNNLLEMQQATGSSLEFIENVKIDLFPEEVYVFTPKGSIKRMPTGATAIDFAYSVHTDIGDTCVAAKIDRQLAPLSTVLHNGQTIEIITSPNARPNPNWLNFVVTGKARSSIRNFLKNQQRAQSVALGKQLLSKSLSSLSLTLRKLPKQSMQQIVKEAGLKSWEDLLEAIGLGNRVAMIDAHKLVKLVQGEQRAHEVEQIEQPAPLFIKGTEGVVVSFAPCCFPIPGDPIVGILRAGSGVIVHTEQCEKIAKFRQNPDVCIPVNWSEETQGEFLVPVKIEVANQRGVLAKAAMAISDADSNIEDITMGKRDGRHVQVTLKVMVTGRKHLASVMRNIRKINRVVRITRARGG